MTGQRPDLFRRDPGAPFDNWEREAYAKGRAKGGSIKSSATAAGVTPQTARGFEKHPEMRARIRELRDGAEDFVGVSLGYIFAQLKDIAEQAKADGEYKPAIEALSLMNKMLSENKDAAANVARALPPNVQGKELTKRLKDAFAPKALPKEKAAYVAPPVPREDDEEAAQ